jgi:glycosyltransferase involved in cell wall biosynthesis
MLALARRGHELEVFVEAERDYGLKVEGARFHFISSKTRGMISQLLSSLGGDFDVVHACDNKILLTNLYCRYFSKLPRVFEVHTAEFEGMGAWELLTRPTLKSLQRFVFFRKEQMCAKTATEVVALSEHSRRLVSDAYGIPLDKIVCVPPGVDRRVFQALRGEASKPRLVTVARLEPVKNIKTLLIAFKQLKQRFPDLKLDIVGEGSQRTSLEAFCAEENIKDVTFHGFLPDEAIAKLLCEAKVFVLPSLAESFGMANLEAMACGLPVVSSRAGAVPEVVGEENGFLVDPLNIDELVDRLCVLLEDEKLRRSIRWANVKKAGDYTWEKRGERIEKIYERVI